MLLYIYIYNAVQGYIYKKISYFSNKANYAFDTNYGISKML